MATVTVERQTKPADSKPKTKYMTAKAWKRLFQPQLEPVTVATILRDLRALVAEVGS